ncbi:carboxymuconolactone decarboxylase family protein [Bradyrhizobium archetypum]|uniref:Alkylhydroperoxidase n=1 Tax=Bradyrhizobium archetypum TaxID=2721160 RepID=A0A7Y4H6M1_9BRAD|nr:alkylhydroperoxidase [Bradyrhizobium archetypum]NOJ48187.1 alkylhydroperoxidase [Bradyrhizobium archetypum]
MFLETIDETEATGRIAELYAAQKAQSGFVMSATRCWTARPDLLPIYQEFADKIRTGFSLSPRDWRLITFVAAKQVPSTYCSHVYGKQLLADLGSKEAVIAVRRNFASARLSERDVEMLRYAEMIASDASRVTAKDIERLRAVGFTDIQICDIAFCAAFRCFVARFFDAVGAGPEPAFIDADADFRKAMTVGRAI